MAHEIDLSTGKAAAMFAETPAWHGLGTVVETAPTSREALKLAGLDWEIEQQPILREVKYHNGGPELITDSVPVPGWVANVRSDTHAALAVVQSSYSPLQNRDAFSFLDSFGDDTPVVYEAAGALNDGKRVWVLARLPGSFDIAEGDTQLAYMLCTTSHDGTSAVRVTPTAVRVVCANTLALALRSMKDGISIRHTGDMTAKMNEASRALQVTRNAMEAYSAKAQRLAEVSLTQETFREYVAALWPESQTTSRANRARRAVAQAFTRDARQQMASIKGTAWAAVNSVTQWHDHDRWVGSKNRRDVKRLQSTLAGGSATIAKQEAFEVATEMFL